MPVAFWRRGPRTLCWPIRTCVGSTWAKPSACDPAAAHGRSGATRSGMKPRLQTSLGQHLVMTPQLRQAIRLLQMSTAELEVELTEAVETNPLLDWTEAAPTSGEGPSSDASGDA